jgi:hypothetical protein
VKRVVEAAELLAGPLRRDVVGGLGAHQAALQHAQKGLAVGGAHDRLLVGAGDRHRVAVAAGALIVHQGVDAVNHGRFGGDPARHLDAAQLAADAHVEEVDQVLAVALDVDAAERDEERAALALGEAAAQHIRVDEALARRAGGLAAGAHVAAVGALRTAAGGHVHVGAEHEPDGADHLGRAGAADVGGDRDAAEAHALQVGEVALDEKVLHEALGAGERPAHQGAVLQREGGQVVGEQLVGEVGQGDALIDVAAGAEVVALDQHAAGAVREVEVLLAVVEGGARGEARGGAVAVADVDLADVDQVAGDGAVAVEVDLRAVGGDDGVGGRGGGQVARGVEALDGHGEQPGGTVAAEAGGLGPARLVAGGGHVAPQGEGGAGGHVGGALDGRVAHLAHLPAEGGEVESHMVDAYAWWVLRAQEQ